jgi:8-oxo-dGTP diphosphatase
MIDPRTGYSFTPCSAKGVILRHSRVLLCLNDRGEWELPGGWPSPDDASLEETVRREVREETGLEVELGDLVTATLLPTPDDGMVALVVFAGRAVSDDAPVASAEHREVRYFDLYSLPDALPEPYRRAIDLARRQPVGRGGQARDP